MQFPNWTQTVDGTDYFVQYAPVGKYCQLEDEQARRVYIVGLNDAQDALDYVIRGDLIVAALRGDGYRVPDMAGVECPGWALTGAAD